MDLIEERGFEALTVGEITDRAMISRATFYRNYQDKYDLVEQIFSEAMGTMFTAISEPGTEHPPAIWVKFFEHIAEYERLYRALLGRKGSSWFVLKMRSSMSELLKEYEKLPFHQSAIGSKNSPIKDDFLNDLVSTLLVETIVWWLEKGKPYSPQVITTRCVSLVNAIFKESISWE
ncbi:MAG TPA: TetR/AcrR family transcriptional regulator [Anaerolineaceae bacterium]|nr:TetR/AcrR family transcriptional regulator [Anaerolineaceae bacterium]